MKLSTLLVPCSLITLVLAGLPAPAAAACPYDLLAMCCTAYKNGSCTRWQNCCHVLATGSGSSSSSDPGRLGGESLGLVAAPQCVGPCDRDYDRAGRAACYERCAEPILVPAGPLIADDFTILPPQPIQLSQIGGTQALVPMEHGSCGIDCNTHVLAVEDGNLDSPFRLRMTCPANQEVAKLFAIPNGGNATHFVNGDFAGSEFDEIVTLQPFSAADFEDACRDEFGDWPGNQLHPDVDETVVTTLQSSIEVFGQCSDWVNSVKRTFPVLVKATCVDTDFPPPAEG